MRGIILAYDRPLGNLHPSSADIQLTERLLEGSRHLEIKVVDHLIVTEKKYFSFSDNALM